MAVNAIVIISGIQLMRCIVVRRREIEQTDEDDVCCVDPWRQHLKKRENLFL
jgi:hypothetical protein